MKEEISDCSGRPADDRETLAAQVRDVKRRLRGVMNGIVSTSMREKGLTYKVNFGVDLPRLGELAEELPHTATLASALRHEDIRECRLLAARLQPANELLPEVADIWVEQMRFTEEAECTVFYLFRHLPYASQKVFEWIAREESMFRLCGWLLLARLFMQGLRPSARDAEEVKDQLAAELAGNEPALKLAARKALLKYMNLGPEEEAQGERLLSSSGQA